MELSVFNQQLEIQEKLLDVIKFRFPLGKSTALDIYQQQQTIEKIRAALIPIQSSQVRISRLLALLTGKTYLSMMIRRRLQAAKISVPTGVSRGTHGFRHAFAVRMTGQVSFKDVVDMLGHRDPSSALIYAKADVQKLQHAALPWPGVSS